jgi:tRNA-modifying protein YgfZ
MPIGYQLGKGTVVRFQGADRCKVFNNLCTQDLRQLADGQALETFVTDVKGRTFGHGIALAIGGDAFFVTVPEQGSKIVPHFDRYIIREDAVLSDLSDAFRFWLFSDRSSAARAFAIAMESIPNASGACTIEQDGQTIILFSAPWVGPESVLALAPSAMSDLTLRDRLGSDWVQSDLNIRDAWELLRIKAFWPWYGVDLDDCHLPQEIDRDKSAISFNKGCYLGQETIARLDMLGKIQKKLVRIAVDSMECPTRSAPIFADDKGVGSVCSAAFSHETTSCMAMAFVKRSHFAVGQALSVGGHQARVL